MMQVKIDNTNIGSGKIIYNYFLCNNLIEDGAAWLSC